MSKIKLYFIVCAVLLIGSIGPVFAFTVSISNYGCVFSGWEESGYYDQYGFHYWYWSGTDTDVICQDSTNYNWETNRVNNLRCQCSIDSGAVITCSGTVPSASYLCLCGYRPHVLGSFIDYYQFDFDLSWSGTFSNGPWYLSVLNQPVDDITKCTSYWTKQLLISSASGSCHATGNLNGSGIPYILLTNVPPAATVPEPSSILALLSGLAGLGLTIRPKRRK